jgi:hypothetical protein
MNCREAEEKLTLFHYDELAGEERREVEAHLAACAACAAAAAELARLRGVLDARPAREPSPELLVQARWALEEALDRETTGWRAVLRSWVAPRTALPRLATGLTLLLLGFSAGWGVQRASAPARTPADVANAAWLGADLDDIRVSGISEVAPDPQTGEVRITMNAERRVTLEGSLDDPRIQQLLMDAVRGYQNPGIRRNTLEALRTRRDDPAVRTNILYALRNDPNAGNRLKALEAVRPLADQPDVRLALLQTIQHDANDGVRVAAIGALVEHPHQDVVPVLEMHSQSDRNAYVRLQCVRALRRIERGEF